ncbi:MAG: transcription elongation factor GreA [Deltaproteobacteria bacterium]
MNRLPITREGYDRLRAELQRLEQKERPKVIQAIAEAREHGDITENAEYEAAKEKQAMLEGKINDLHHKLSQCEIVEVAEGSVERVTFGSTVVLADLDAGEEMQYCLVGPYEAIGKALIGKEPGDEVRVQTPGGVKNLEILDILYAGKS